MASLMVLFINATDSTTNIPAKPSIIKLIEVRFGSFGQPMIAGISPL
jgi:hypothetical protein